MDTFNQILAELSNLRWIVWLARHEKWVSRAIYTVIAIFLGLWLAIWTLQVVEFNRDDLNKAYYVLDGQLTITGPRVLHNNREPYEIIIEPSNTVDTITARITSIRHAAILPDQPTVFTFAKDRHTSYTLRIQNYDAPLFERKQGFLQLTAPLSMELGLAIEAGPMSDRLRIEREAGWLGMLRQTLPPLNTALLVIGAVLLFLAQLGKVRQSQQTQAIQEQQQKIDRACQDQQEQWLAEIAHIRQKILSGRKEFERARQEDWPKLQRAYEERCTQARTAYQSLVQLEVLPVADAHMTAFLNGAGEQAPIHISTAAQPLIETLRALIYNGELDRQMAGMRGVFVDDPRKNLQYLKNYLEDKGVDALGGRENVGDFLDEHVAAYIFRGFEPDVLNVEKVEKTILPQLKEGRHKHLFASISRMNKSFDVKPLVEVENFIFPQNQDVSHKYGSFLKPEDYDRLLIICGHAGSGKTSLLKQTIRYVLISKRSGFAGFIAIFLAEETAATVDVILGRIVRALILAIKGVLDRYPSFWEYVLGHTHKEAFLRCLRGVYAASDLVPDKALADLVSVIDQLDYYVDIYVMIDGVETTQDAECIFWFLRTYITKQNVHLYCTCTHKTSAEPGQFSLSDRLLIDLAWNEKSLTEIFKKNIFNEDPRIQRSDDDPSVDDQGKQIEESGYLEQAIVGMSTSPRDLKVWHRVIQDKQPEPKALLRPIPYKEWRRWCAAMHEARRANRGAQATGWLPDDWHHAQEILEQNGQVP